MLWVAQGSSPRLRHSSSVFFGLAGAYAVGRTASPSRVRHLRSAFFGLSGAPLGFEALDYSPCCCAFASVELLSFAGLGSEVRFLVQALYEHCHFPRNLGRTYPGCRGPPLRPLAADPSPRSADGQGMTGSQARAQRKIPGWVWWVGASRA